MPGTSADTDGSNARTRGAESASRVALAGTSVLVATGIALFFAPATLAGQAVLLVHVALGLVVGPLLLVWLWIHTVRWWSGEQGAFRGIALLATALLTAGASSGLALLFMYASGSSAPDGLRSAHIVAGATLIVLLPIHIISARRRATDVRRSHGGAMAAALGVTFVAVIALSRALDSGDGLVPVPDDYPRTPDGGVFSASFASTPHDGFVELQRLTGSENCGVCHAEIYQEWSVGTHRFSGIDNPLIATATRPAEANGGPAAARFCAACHEPVSLLAGGIRESAFAAPPEQLEIGVNCLVCHGIQRVPGSDGNGRMIFEPPDGFALSNRGTWLSDAANRVLVSSFPEAHRDAMAPPVIRTSHQCSSCHTVNAHAGLNGFGFVRLHNENDDWGVSAFAHGVGDEDEVVGCQDCHMGRVQHSRDPVAKRRGGTHRSHRFLGANTFVAKHLGDDQQFRDTERFLRGEAFPAEIRHLLPEGPPVSLDIEVAEAVEAGSQLDLSVVLTNRSVGHAFPAGPNEVNEAWVEVLVEAEGVLVFSSGELDAQGKRDPAAFALISVPVDREGNEIAATGGLAAGFRQRRAILHGAADRERYRFPVSAELAGKTLEVSARLRYRKADAEFVQLMEGFSMDDIPVTDLVLTRQTVRILAPGSSMVASKENE